MMKHCIRHSESPDFATLLDIDQECFPEGISFDESELRYYLELPTAFTLVAEAGDRIVGFAVLAVENSATAATLVTLDVLDRFRRCGVGSSLLLRSQQLIRESGATSLDLQVDVHNVPAISFYKAHGFSIIGRVEAYYGTGRDAYQMTKRLRGNDPSPAISSRSRI